MSKQQKLERLFKDGKISRREFIARASALGLTAAISPMLFSIPGKANADTTITLDGSVHFTIVDGGDIVLDFGSYDVASAKEWSRITPSGGTAIYKTVFQQQNSLKSYQDRFFHSQIYLGRIR